MRKNTLFQSLILSIFTILLAFFSTGCGGGGGSGIGSGKTVDGGGDSGGSGVTPGIANATVAAGWSNLNSGSFTQAKQHFTGILNSKTATAKEKAEASVGLGWVTVRASGGFYDDDGLFNEEVLDYFEGGKTLYDDGKVGLAMAYLHRNKTVDDSSKAVVLLEEVLAKEKYEPVNQVIGIGTADVYLLLALSKMEIGDKPGAQSALNKARSLGSTADSTVFENISAALDTLL